MSNEPQNVQLSCLPIFAELAASTNVLIAGAGGGFDLFSGLPIYFYLKNQGKTVHLANLSFSDLSLVTGRSMAKGCFAVDYKCDGARHFFPEKFLCEWFRQQGEEIPIYCFEHDSGPSVLSNAYDALVKTLKIDTIILVDGGTDSLLFGDEEELGTPLEDMSSICAANGMNVQRKYLISIGFGIDSHHGVCHAHVLENISKLITTGGYIGSFSLIEQMPEFRSYRKATEFVLSKTPDRESIVCTSILAATTGKFGDYHSTERTKDGELFINPLMSIYWCFYLSSIAEQIPYLKGMDNLSTLSDVDKHIRNWRSSLKNIRAARNIPA